MIHCALCQKSFHGWREFDSHGHLAGMESARKYCEAFVPDVVACKDTMKILETLVVEDEDGPTHVYQDAGYLTTDVLRRMAMTNDTYGEPQPKKPIGPFESCAHLSIFIVVCVHRWNSVGVEETRKSILRIFSRLDGAKSPAFPRLQGITYHDILRKRLQNLPLTAEENESIRLKDGYTKTTCVPWKSIQNQKWEGHIYTFLDADIIRKVKNHEALTPSEEAQFLETLPQDKRDQEMYFPTLKECDDVLYFIRQGMTTDGVSIDEMVSRFSMKRGFITRIVDELANEGLIYSTVDDDHYAAV